MKDKALDFNGHHTLEIVSAAENFNKWMYDNIKPYCKNEILEIGSGIGNISKHFINNGASITLSDVDPFYCSKLNKFQKHSNVKDILELDLVHADFENEYKQHLGKFDTVFALNVVEHIQQDHLAISNCSKLLKNEGRIIILVPAYQFLYNKLDIQLSHHRRYTRKSLTQLLKKNDFLIETSFYFNFPAIFGWFISGYVQRNKSIPEKQMKLYNLLVPLFRIVDKLVFNKAGLSVIAVGRKKIN